MIDFGEALEMEKELNELQEWQEFLCGPLFVWEYWNELKD